MALAPANHPARPTLLLYCSGSHGKTSEAGNNSVKVLTTLLALDAHVQGRERLSSSATQGTQLSPGSLLLKGNLVPPTPAPCPTLACSWPGSSRSEAGGGDGVGGVSSLARASLSLFPGGSQTLKD